MTIQPGDIVECVDNKGMENVIAIGEKFQVIRLLDFFSSKNQRAIVVKPENSCVDEFVLADTYFRKVEK